MNTRLHITNGDSAGITLQCVFPEDTILPWRDCLHDGPLPSLPHREFSEARARFIAAAGWGPLEEVQRSFDERDDILERAADFPEVVLWFEHDLYDQLQLIQVLTWFEQQPHPALRLIQAYEYLGPLPGPRLAEMFPERQPVQAVQLESAARAWRALTSGEPPLLEAVLGEWPALIRLAEDYPWTSDGLTRTERTIAGLKARGIEDRFELFRAFGSSEDPMWMGDSSFFRILDGARDRAASGWRWDPEARRFTRWPTSLHP